MKYPKVFISYSHESKELDQWVNLFAASLHVKGVDIVLDQWDLHLGQDITTFMEKGLSEADRVLVICSKKYFEKANKNKGGVGYEKMIVNADLLKDLSTIKYIPIIPPKDLCGKVPDFLGTRYYVDFRDEKIFSSNINSLVEEIHLGYTTEKLKLGKNPFELSEQNFKSNEIIIDLDWYKKHSEKAYQSLKGMGYETFMEIISYPTNYFKKHEQKRLLEAVHSSQNQTFGWPIGIIINSNECKPRPLADGIYAEIAVDDPSLFHNKSYDYWAISTSGIIYMIKSLFEDLRDPTAIFFNTRILRNTEVLLFCKNLYSNLGYDADSNFFISIRYSGLQNRLLKSSTVNRHYSPKQTFENEITTHVTATLNDISGNLLQLTKEFTAPLFNVFEFAEFNDAIYEKIINYFLKGKVS